MLKKVREAQAVAGALKSFACSTNKTRWPTGIGARNARTRHLCLWTLPLAVLFSFAVASNCNIDLSQIASDSSNPGTAQCDAGCDLCSFTLATGVFEYGTIECLANAQCRITVETTEYRALKYTTVNGAQASALTVETANGLYPWYLSVLYAPQNGGNFQFDCSSRSCVYKTKFHAQGSGDVEFTFTNDGMDSTYNPELSSMSVFASTAAALKIVMAENSLYSMNDESAVECPEFGACVWQSDGQRYDQNPFGMSVVNLILFPATKLQYVCGNAESCAGVFVHCQEENCEIQYLADAWQCIGTLILANNGNVWQCNALPTTTVVHDTSTAVPDTTRTQPMTTLTDTSTIAAHTTAPPNADTTTVAPATTAPVDTSSTDAFDFTASNMTMYSSTLPENDSGNSKPFPLMHAAIGVGIVVVLGFTGCCCFYWYQRVASKRDEDEISCDHSTEMGVRRVDTDTAAANNSVAETDAFISEEQTHLHGHYVTTAEH